MIQLLAEAATPETTVSVKVVATLLTTIFSGLALVAGKFWGEKRKQTVKVSPLPLPVQTSEHDPISRHEFNLHRAANESRFTAIETNQIRAQDNVERKHIELLATIERAAKVGVEGRVSLWNELKPVGRELAALQATSNVSEQLGKLGEALTKLHQSNGCKTTGV